MRELKFYNKIMFVRRVFILSFLSVPFYMPYAHSLDETGRFTVITVGITTFIISGFLVQAMNLCPWCNKPFFNKLEDSAGNPLSRFSWLTRTTCVYRGKPENDK